MMRLLLIIGLIGFWQIKGFSNQQEPPPAQPQNCQAQRLDVTVLNQSRSLSVPNLNHDEKFKSACSQWKDNDQVPLKGDIEVKCHNGQLSVEKNECALRNREISCSWQMEYPLIPDSLNQVYSNGLPSQLRSYFPDYLSSYDTAVLVRPVCRVEIENPDNVNLGQIWFTVRGAWKVAGLSACSGGVDPCYADPLNLVNNPRDFKVGLDEDFLRQPISSGEPPIEPRAVIIVTHKKDQDSTINQGQVKWEVSLGSQTKSFDAPELSLSGWPKEPDSCRLTVSGTVGPYSNDNPPKVAVHNDTLVFTPVLEGGSGSNNYAYSVTYSGGPSANGVWSGATPGQENRVTATIKMPSGNTFSCSLIVIPQATVASVRLRGFTDCEFFNELRKYYFLNANNNGFQNQPLNLRIPGSEAIYGRRGAEVPFAGIWNIGEALNQALEFNDRGRPIIPPLDRRAYSKVVLVVREFTGESKAPLGNVLYYGLVDPGDYQVVQLVQVNAPSSPETSVVFQMYLARAQPVSTQSGVLGGFRGMVRPRVLRDIRGMGEPGSIPYWQLATATQDGDPFDKIIPFANESCVQLFQFKPPARSDKPLPQALTKVPLCLYSRPFKVADVTAGRVDLTALLVTPPHPNYQYPAQLLKASNKPPCVARNPNDTVECWQVTAGMLGISAQTNPYAEHSQCREERTELVNKSVTTCYRDRYGRQVCYTYDTPTYVTIVSYKPSCPVLESQSECSRNLALRFTGYNMQMIAALGCAVKYNKPNELIAATLLNQGVLPYTPALGGSNPQSYQNYTPAYGARKGYGCIPCRFQSDALRVGRDIVADTAVLPVDQDANVARKPIFSFSKSRAPRECVEEMNFEVRYFGSSACTGVNNPPGHFCRSENLGGQTCPAGVDPENPNFSGSGNVAGKFKARICPGSGFEYENLSVSWSPILIDVVGNGVEISRRADWAVNFDIRGNGKPLLVDWPVNTHEVAFLVLPDKNGRVKNVKQLFGDDQFRNGFEKLKSFDRNKDGKIDSRDPVYGQLRLWFDRNRDGVAQADELHTLTEFGVETLYLDYFQRTQRGIEGKTLHSVYYNQLLNTYLNYGDYYFQTYQRR